MLKTKDELLNHLKEYFKEDSETLEYFNAIEQGKNNDDIVPSHFFYGTGEGIEKVLHVIEKGDEMLPRLQEIYKATAGSDYSYFVQNEHPILRKDLEGLVNKFIANLLVMIDFTEESYPNDFLEEFKKNPPAIELIKGEGPKQNPSDDDDFTVSVYELQHEFIYALETEESLGLEFSEALYQMACSYDIVHYVLWPFYEKKSPLKDPFKVLIDLWKIHAVFSFDYEKNSLKVYVPLINEE